MPDSNNSNNHESYRIKKLPFIFWFSPALLTAKERTAPHPTKRAIINPHW